MKIDVQCPQCKREAVSRLRKITVPGLYMTCKSCRAELGVQAIFSVLNVSSFIVFILTFTFFRESYLYWLGWLVLIFGGTCHLAQVPLKVINPGPNHGEYNS